MKKIIMILLNVFVIALCASCVFASGDTDSLDTNETLQVNNDTSISVDLQKDFDLNCNESADDVLINESADTADDKINESIDNDDVQINENNNSSMPQITNEPIIPSNNTNINSSTNGSYYVSKEEFDFFFDFLKEILDYDYHKMLGPKLKPTLDIKGPNFGNLKKDGPEFLHLYKERNNIKEPGLKDYQRLMYHYANIFIDHPEWGIVRCIECVVDDLYTSSHYTDGDICAIVAEAHEIALRNYNGNDMA